VSGAKHNPVCATLLKRMRIAAFFTNGKKPVQVTPFSPPPLRQLYC